MRYHDRTRNREWVLRLWNSGYKNTSGDTIWVGSVSDLKLKKSMKLVSYPTNGDNFDLPLQVLQDQFPELHPKLVTRPGYTATHRQGWNGDVLLVCS
jgi:predicted PolB exonuclease-like 3'-5' exonuclease